MTERQLRLLLKMHRGVLSRQTIRTINGQINAGDYDGAFRGLTRSIRRLNYGNGTAKEGD